MGGYWGLAAAHGGAAPLPILLCAGQLVLASEEPVCSGEPDWSISLFPGFYFFFNSMFLIPPPPDA